MPNIPYGFYGGSATSVGKDIYLFGGYNTNYSTYKYDTLGGTYTELVNIPYAFKDGSVAVSGTNIYVLGGYNTTESDRQYNYKYDTLVNRYTKMTDIPNEFPYGSATSYGNNIYIVGGGDRNPFNKFYEYNTLTDTYTQLTNTPYAFYNGSAVYANGNIYMLGGNGNNTGNRKYILLAKSYETDNSVVIASGNIYNIKLFNTNFESDYQPLYGFNDAFFYTLQDGLDGTMPVYYGNGTQWINIKNPIVEEVEE